MVGQSKIKKVSKKYLRTLFDYDADSGNLIWKRQKARRTKIGSRVGHLWGNDGRLRVGIDGKYYYVSRLVWGWHYEKVPQYIDHIDGDPSNNRIGNLRAATFSQNQMNRGANKNHSLGIKNVYKAKKRFLVNIMIEGKSHYKTFISLKEAKQHADYLRKKLHGQFARAS